MKETEFIGIYKGGCKVRDAVRGVILDAQLFFNEPLIVFYLGGTIWKRSGRRGILEKVLREDDVIVQRYSKIRFQLIKVFDRVISTEELERKIEYTKIYRIWKEEVLRQEN